MASYSYFSTGFSYYDGHTTYYTYYPRLSSIKLTPSVTSIANGGFSAVRVDVLGTNLMSKQVNIKVSQPASLLANATKLNSASTISSNAFIFKVYNKNVTTDDSSTLVNVTATVSYFGQGGYQVRSVTKSLALTLRGQTVQPNSGYYNYYNTYYTYFYNGSLTTTYYKLTNFDVTLNASKVAYNGSIKLTPKISTNCSAATVSSMRYTVASPYTVSLSKTSFVSNGSTSATGTIAVYNRNIATTDTVNKIAVTANTNFGSFTKTILLNVEGKALTPSIIGSISLSKCAVSAGDTFTAQLSYSASNDTITSVKWNVSSSADVTSYYNGNLATIHVNSCYYPCSIYVAAIIVSKTGLTKVISSSCSATPLNNSGSVVTPTVSTYYWIDSFDGSNIIPASKSGINVFVTNGTSASPISVSWYPSDSSYYQYVDISKSSDNGASVWIGRTSHFSEENKIMKLNAFIVGRDGFKTTVKKDIVIEGIKEEETPKITSFDIVAPATIPFNGKTEIKYNATVSADTIRKVNICNVVGPSYSCAYFISNGVCTGTTGVLGTVGTNPSVSHSGNAISLTACLETQKGLVKYTYCTLGIGATDYSYYQTYYAPIINYVGVTGSTNIDCDGSAEYVCNYGITRDALKSITWSTDSDCVTINTIGNKCTVVAQNEEYVKKTVKLTATVMTINGLRQSASKTVIVGAAEIPAEETSSVEEVSNVIAAEIQKVEESISGLKAKIAEELAKLG